MNKRLWIFSIRTVRDSAIFLFFALFSAGVSWGIENAYQEMEAQPGNKENLFLAMHFGQSHDQHHGEGRKSSGICPQTRTTPQAPEEDYKMKNPLKPSRQNLARGESLFNLLAQPTACKICHGAKGNGLGIMAQGLSPMPRNFTCSETMREISDGQMFWIIRNGSPGMGMQPYRFLTDEEIWQLILYVRQFVK